jgi:uncharacterized protein YkwD
MGIESRDWYREPRERAGSSRLKRLAAIAVALVVVLVLVDIKRLHRVEQASSAGEGASLPGNLEFSIFPGLPSITIRKGSLYPSHDPWQAYLADEQTCPGGERSDAPLNEQTSTMSCLINYARAQRGLAPLTTVSFLDDSALKKADRITRCGQFAHDACGEDPAADVRAGGYRGAWGENLYLGEGRLGAPRVALDGWLNSPGHRDNLFQPEWRSEGIAVIKVDRLGGYSGAEIWIDQFATG